MKFSAVCNKRPDILAGQSIQDFINYNLYFTISIFLLVAVQRLFLYPFIANKFGSENFGSFVLFMTIVNIAIVVIPGSVNMVILREHSSYKDSEKVSLIKSGLLVILCISLVVIVSIYFVFPKVANLFKISSTYKIFIIPLLIYIVLYGMREGLLILKRVELKFIEIALYNIIFAILFFALIPMYYFLKDMGIFWGYVLIAIIATAIVFPKSKEIFKGKFEIKYLKEFYKYSPTFAFVSFLELSLLASSRYIISYYKNPTQVAYFFAAVSIIQMLSFPFAQVRTILLSFISQRKNIEDFRVKDIKIIFILSLIIGFVLLIIGLIFAKLIIGKLYGSIYYENSRLALVILLIGQIFFILKMYLNNFIIIYFKRKTLNWNFTIMFLINIILNIIGVPKYGINASAFAFSFSLFVSTFWWYILLLSKLKKANNKNDNVSLFKK